jgi:hypothetical protein
MTIKVVRNPARKIDFNNSEVIEPARERSVTKPVAKFSQPPPSGEDTSKKQLGALDKEIDEKLEALENAAGIVEKIQDEIDSRTETLNKKEEQLSEREEALEKTAALLTNLNSLELEDLDKDELKQITNEQEGFIRDLIDHYVESEDRIQKLKEKPWAGKGSETIIRENKELKARNKELTEEIDDVLKKIEEIQEED